MRARFLTAKIVSKSVLMIAPLLGSALLLTGWFGGGRPARAAELPQTSAAECGTENLLAGKLPSQRNGMMGDAALITNRSIAPEGAIWDVPVVIKLVSAGAVTYDLGKPSTVGALYLQADANDTYRITGSLDGSPGSFKFLGEMPNVVDRGPGLRGRVLQILPVAVRYLRVGEAQGDGAFSISEFAAYCHAPAPFPPAFPVVDAPLAAAPPPANARPAGPTAAQLDAVGRESNGRLALSILALLMALIGAGGWLRAKKTHSAGMAEATSGKLGVSRLSTHDLLRLIFVASGAAALIYEVVWFHLLRLVIGASALSVGIVLASFMGGMFLGSLLFARLVSPERNALRVYAALEVGIGLFGLLMPVLLPAVRFVYVGLVGYGTVGIALRAVVAAMMLLPPTALMGATLPAVARRYAHGRRGMSGLASLYAANTTGAVLGCLLSGFYLLAVWDVWVATAVAAALNFLVGWTAFQRSKTARPEEQWTVAEVPRPARARGHELRAVYLAVGLSGLTALGAQVIWTRLLTLLFGATVYAFSIILAVFLAGLGLGSIAASYLLRRGQHAARALAWTQLALVPAVLSAAYLLADVLPFASPPAATPLTALHALHVLRAMAVVLPGAVLWGMSFPFALAAASSSGGDTGRSSGHVYASNTLGAIIGALAVSFWAVPSFGSRWAEQSLEIIAGISAAVLFHVLGRAWQPDAGARATKRMPSAAWPLAVGALAAGFLPGPSAAFLAHGRYIWWVDARDQYPYVSEGAASTVAVHVAPDGYKNFHVSGRVEATNNPNDMRLQRLLGHLSALAHPHPESVLVVGMGAGTTAGALALHPEIKRVVICEIEPRVVGAANQFALENYDVLKNPKVEVVFDDARHFLATTREAFDIITSDPIHPWVRGNSVLFSREYYAVVKSRLKPGGIATQWVPLYETNELAIQIQAKTFMDAFPQGTVWNSAANGKGYDVVLLGQTGGLHMDLTKIQARIDHTPIIGLSLQEVKIGSAVDLLATYGAGAADMKGWYANTPLNRDFSLKLEYISGLALNSSAADDIYAHMIANRTYPSDIFTAPPALEAELRRRIIGDR
ncbi:MAG: fused MFS/spermidine synthase [Myxococcales bacterium]